MHTPDWAYVRQYFWVRLAANFREGKIDLKKIQNSRRTYALIKLNLSKSCCVDKIFGFSRNVYSIEEPLLNYSTPSEFHTQGIARLTLTMISHLPTI